MIHAFYGGCSRERTLVHGSLIRMPSRVWAHATTSRYWCWKTTISVGPASLRAPYGTFSSSGGWCSWSQFTVVNTAGFVHHGCTEIYSGDEIPREEGE